MTRLTIISAALAASLVGAACIPAAAADLGPSVIYHRHPGPYVKAPYHRHHKTFYVVDQGPDITGLGIVITEPVIRHTCLKHRYPFVTTRDIALADRTAGPEPIPHWAR